MHKIDKVLSKMSNNFERNRKLIIYNFGSMNYTDKNKNSLLHLAIIGNGTEDQKRLAIFTLFTNGVNPNQVNISGDTFLHLAMKEHFSINFINYLLIQARNFGFDFNIQNKNDYTFFHTAIDYTNLDNLLEIAIFLKSVKFNFNIKIYGKDALTLIKSRYRDEFVCLSKEQQGEWMKITGGSEMNYKNTNGSMNRIDDNMKKELIKYGRFLTEDITLEYPPAVGRDNEVLKVIVSLAQEKKLPLLVGPPGVGKTTIVDQIAYLIKRNEVPTFLENWNILEVSTFNMVAGTKYRGDLEERVVELFDYCANKNIILFIDEFHLIVGAGSAEKDKVDIAIILQNYIDRNNLKVIGATTDEDYDELLGNHPIKRRFTKIMVDEPDKIALYDIIEKTFYDMAKRKNIMLSNEIIENLDYIIELLIDLTKENHRQFNDRVNNPDLVISIIDLSFAYALVNSDNELQVDYLIQGIDGCERIYPSKRFETINRLKELFEEKQQVLKKARIIEFNKELIQL